MEGCCDLSSTWTAVFIPEGTWVTRPRMVQGVDHSLGWEEAHHMHAMRVAGSHEVVRCTSRHVAPLATLGTHCNGSCAGFGQGYQSLSGSETGTIVKELEPIDAFSGGWRITRSNGQSALRLATAQRPHHSHTCQPVENPSLKPSNSGVRGFFFCICS